MQSRRTFIAVAAATATGLAGCIGGGGGGAETDSPTETPMATPTDGPMDTPTETPMGTPTDEPMAATVSVATHPELGDILVDGAGMTLYMFDRDTQGAGASVCTEGCAEAWPPLLAAEPTAGEGVSAELTILEREDGGTQVAAAGWPLYYFASDESPGDANGQAVGDVWWVLGPDGTPKREGMTTETATQSIY